MVDRAKKISELSTTTVISNTDLIPIVANLAGTPASKTISYGNFANAVIRLSIPATNTYILFGANSLISGSANLTFSNNVFSVGNSTVNTSISAAAVGGNASFTMGNTTINGTLTVGDITTVNTFIVNGMFTATSANVELGTAGQGNTVVKISGALSSNITPDTPNNYFLGSPTHPWATLWASTIRTSDLTYNDTNIVLQMGSNTASYLQAVLQNSSAAANASTNYNVSADTANATFNYGEFGINSSTFSGSGRFSDPLAVYLGAATSNLAIGTYGSNPVNIVVNSSINWTFGTDSTLTLPNGPKIFTGNATTRSAVNTQVGTAGSNGSIYLSTAGKIYLRVNGTGTATTDWQRVTTTAVD